MATIVVDLRSDAWEKPVLPGQFTEGVWYVDAYIRTRTPSYRPQSGNSYPSFSSPVAEDHWKGVCAEIAEAAGFVLKESGFYYRNECKFERIHFHPDSISVKGTLETLKRIEIIAGAYPGVFEVNQTDIYRGAELLSADEASLRVAHYRADIEAIILEKYKTTRRDRYQGVDMYKAVSGLPGLALHGPYAGASSALEQARRDIDKIRESLISQGLLIPMPGDDQGFYFRSANTRERSALRKKTG